MQKATQRLALGGLSGCGLFLFLAATSCGGDLGDSNGSGSSVPRAAASTNLVVMLVDTLRRDHLGAFGSEAGLTPYLDTFAEEGASFPNAFATCSWTKPSVASVMTGLYPGQHSAVRAGSENEASAGSGSLRNEQVTLAEEMQAAGYATGAFVANVHIRKRTRFDQGFETFVYDTRIASQVLGAALGWVDECSGERPFFLYVHLFDPHAPYVPPPPFDQDYTPKPIDGASFTNRGDEVEVKVWVEARNKWEAQRSKEPFAFDYQALYDRYIQDMPGGAKIVPDADALRKSINLDFTGFDDPRLTERVDALFMRYRGEVAYTDAEIERFMAGLEERGLLDSTTVLLVADHGEAFLEHKDWGHHNTLSAQEINVPMMLRIPGPGGVPLTGVFEAPVSLVDIYPTLLDIQGIPIPDGLSGLSLWPLIHSEGKLRVPSRAIFSELIESTEDRVAIIQDGRKVVRSVSESGSVAWEMYDLVADPGDFSPMPVDDTDPATAAMMRGIGTFLKSRLLGQLPYEDEEAISEEDIADLKRLGYM